jgi:hypothetical protein
MNINPETNDTGLQDCRSVLNNIVTRVTVHNDKTDRHETNTGWKTVESKQDIKEKRMRTRMSAGKTEDMSRVNGKPNCKRVSFGSNSDSREIRVESNFD